MPIVEPPELLDVLVGEDVCTLTIPDLDAKFGLKIRSMIAASFPLMYESVTRNVDVAAMRRRGLTSVVTFAEFERIGGPLAVGGPLHMYMETRLSELSGAGLGQVRSRLGFETRYAFESPPGVGDPLRYREFADAQSLPCGRGRIILTIIRPFDPATRRLVFEQQPETDHIRIHVLDGSALDIESLSLVPPGYTQAEPSVAERRGVFGLQNTDINQVVYAGDYAALLEDHSTALLAASGSEVVTHHVDRVAMVFKSPFIAGSSYAVRGTLSRNGDSTVVLVGVHSVSQDESVQDRPAVFGRIEGRFIS